VGTAKRERQKAARIEKALAEAAAAKRARRRRALVRIVIGSVVVLAVLFLVSTLMGDDGGDDAEGATEDTSEDTTTTSTTAPTTTSSTTPPSAYSNPELAAEIIDRIPPIPQPPPEDTPPDALEVTTLIEGEGEGAAVGDTVVVHYVGVLEDGTEFDSSWGGDPFEVTLGAGTVIQGWDEGLVGARIGERRHLLIGSEKAYGAEGRGTIPPDAPLAFDVDVVDIRRAGG
jgi:peptidylprolyl isomerase